MITVVIPTKDRLEDLLACLAALSAQDAPELLSRVIVVDDYSRSVDKEQVVAWGQKIGLPLLHVSNPGCSGAAAARNQGALYAGSPVIGFLDDDSVPATNWLTTIARSMDRSEVAAVTGRILPLEERHLLSRARQLRYDMRQRRAIVQGGPVAFLAGGNGAVRRADFERVGGFDQSLTLMHDRDLILRLKKLNRHCYYQHDLIVRHRHFKTLSLAFGQSFRSGYYHLKLEQRNPDISPWSWRSQWHALWELIQVGRIEHQGLPAAVASLMEIVHSVGYCWYRALSSQRTDRSRLLSVLGRRMGVRMVSSRSVVDSPHESGC